MSSVIALLSDDKSYIDSLENKYDAIKNSEKHEEINTLLFEIYTYYEDRDVDKLFEVCNSGIELAQRAKDMKFKYEWLMRKGTIHRKLGNRTLSMENYQKAMVLLNKEGMVMPWFNITMGNFFYSNSNYDKALRHYETAIETFIDLKEIDEEEYLSGMAVSLNNIGLCNDMIDDSAEVLNYFHQAFELRKKLKDNYALSHSALTIGKYYNRRENYDSALYYLDLSLDYDSKAIGKSFYIEIILEKAKLYCDLDNYDEAIKQCKLAEATAISKGKKRFLPEIYFIYTEIYSRYGEYQEAINYGEKGLKYAEIHNNSRYKLELLNVLVSVYDKIGDTRSAYEKLWEYQKLSEEESISKIEQMQYNFEIDQRENQIDLLNKNIEHLERISDMKLTIAILLVIAMLISVALLIVIIRKNRRVRKLLENEKRSMKEKLLLRIY